MLALAALLVGLLGASVILGSEHVTHRALTVVVLEGIGAAWTGTGLFAWWRRPANRLGALMTFTGFAWLLNAFTLAESPAIFTLAALVSNVYLAAFVHLLLAYPDGRLERREHRWLVGGAYALAVLGPAPMLMFGFDALRADCECPASIIQVSGDKGLGDALNAGVTALGVVLVLYLVAVLVGRRRAATPPQRRAMAPVLWSGVVLMLLVAATLSTQAVTGND